MTSRTKALLWSAVGCYAVVKGYQRIRNPSPETNWLIFFDVVLVGISFCGAFEASRNKFRDEPETPTKRLIRTERIGLKAIGTFVTLVGLMVLVGSCSLMREQWVRMTRWPHVNAVLISKDISRGGARMMFQYEVGGYRVTGVGFRWGDANMVRAALESYEPGTVQRISYDPEDPRRVETVLSYS